jgi:hypothetical protein
MPPKKRLRFDGFKSQPKRLKKSVGSPPIDRKALMEAGKKVDARYRDQTLQWDDWMSELCKELGL